MPTAQQLIALIKSHVRGDEERFYSLALQIAATEARHGHTTVAEELKQLLEDARSPKPRLVSASGPLPAPRVRAELSSLMAVEYPKDRLPKMVLAHPLLAQLRRILYEQRQRAKLREHGLNPRRKLLLVGPPGTGKTMTGAILAGELGLPLFSVLLHGVITKFMGESAAKLRLIFDAIAEMRGVYLFDELDALGAKRGADNDVGEARRILNSFLQFLEQDHSDALIVATTNHEELLDRALFRRFDAILHYQLPSAEIIVEGMKTRLEGFNTESVEWERVAAEAKGLSHAEIIGAAQDAARDAVLDRGSIVLTADLITALGARRRRSG